MLWLNSLGTWLQTVYDIDYQVGPKYISLSHSFGTDDPQV
jgi:hypothetical protein